MFVCNHCVNDKDIKEFILEKGEESECSYCTKTCTPVRTRIVAFEGFIEFFLEHISNEYGDPLDDLVDKDDGKSFGIEELLADYGIDLTDNNDLFDAVCESLSDRSWCEKLYYMPELSEALCFDWNQFVDVVKHKSRYVFYRRNDDYYADAVSPHKFLEELSNVIKSTELYTTIKKGTFFYRVRIHDKSKKLTKATELGTPEIKYAKYSNRMSPAGIPMFYGAFDIGTAIKETFDSNNDIGKTATVAKFKLLNDITLIDFSKPLITPSLFQDHGYSHQEVTFINGFISDITKPISKDGYEHIEYVPTQIVTEHFRYAHKDENYGKILGLI
ncbi:HEPN-associated N-terminal domain-containing protein [Methylicorpusculum sp.]|uniref:HEPN-associated N-terminal domain-containing protein n=1 Tax=Methylicorpusculum sp. TaxID=2713644 RepID=UPI002725D257|nr:HEPN-associated N-terminal domain-containing protein [Methylicorpusculum sp.]MDO8846730.1 HEPN-associated N-terminal domain-containing protein [Methylicorpusculum sp.]